MGGFFCAIVFISMVHWNHNNRNLLMQLRIIDTFILCHIHLLFSSYYLV